MAVTSAGPYENQLHLKPDRQTCQHLISQFFYRLKALPDTQPTVSKHWRQQHSVDENVYYRLQYTRSSTLCRHWATWLGAM